MCDFCKQTDVVLSGLHTTTFGRLAFADLRLDLENKQLDMEFGLLDINGSAGKDTAWSDAININYCPICGKKLKEAHYEGINC